MGIPTLLGGHLWAGGSGWGGAFVPPAPPLLPPSCKRVLRGLSRCRLGDQYFPPPHSQRPLLGSAGWQALESPALPALGLLEPGLPETSGLSHLGACGVLGLSPGTAAWTQGAVWPEPSSPSVQQSGQAGPPQKARGTGCVWVYGEGGSSCSPGYGRVVSPSSVQGGVDTAGARPLPRAPAQP